MAGLHTLAIKVFPGATNLPLWVAEAYGFLRARGLALDIRDTAGSVEQLTELIAGEHDLVMTLMDNVVAYASGQGEVAAAGDSDLVAVIGSDDGFSRLVVQPDISGLPDLRGRTLSVDAMTTGLAFVLRRLLALNGVEESTETFGPAGGVLQRWPAMMAGRPAATLLVTPFEFMAEPRGLRVLARGSDAVPRYQGNVIATRRRWAQDNTDRLVAFCAAWLDALDWLFEPANRAAAIDMVCANMPDMARPIAARTCDVFLSPGGFARDGACDPAAVSGVLELRRAYGPAGGVLAGPDAFVDTRYVARARELLAG